MPYPPNVVIIPPGGTPAGAFVAAPVVGVGRPPPILADAVDPTTGEIRTLFAGFHPVDGAFLDQIGVRAGSGAAVNGGQAFEAIKKNLDDTDKRLRFEAQRIAQPFVDRGQLEITDLETLSTDENGDPIDLAGVFVAYRNRMTDKIIPVRQ